MARQMSPPAPTELHRIHDRSGRFLMVDPLADALIGPGYQASPWVGDGPTLYAVPGPDGRYEWAGWATASRCGWNERDGRRTYEGEGLERRFLVLYYPAPVRAWPFFWRLVERQPRRLDVCRGRVEAEWLANQEIRRRQHGFHSAGWGGVVAVWGWDDRAIDEHAECWAGCGCDGPERERDFVVIVEFETETAAMRPDVNLERAAWMAELDVERAHVITAYCDGRCDPACAHCTATHEEIEAAWSWLSAHRREVRAWRRRQPVASGPEAKRGER
jgi:hypothetical protein